MSKICSELHQILNQLPRYDYQYDPEQIPNNGILFLFENGEEAHGYDRIVHVGTHRGEDRLPLRLNDHFVNENKDFSILRKNIGRAILNKNDAPFIKQWEVDLTSRKAREQYSWQIDINKQEQIESLVTSYIHSNFSFCVIEVNDRDKRIYLKARFIATFAQCDTCRPSRDWLGEFSPKEKIRTSGLWNVRYQNGEAFNEIEYERLNNEF